MVKSNSSRTTYFVRENAFVYSTPREGSRFAKQNALSLILAWISKYILINCGMKWIIQTGINVKLCK